MQKKARRASAQKLRFLHINVAESIEQLGDEVAAAQGVGVCGPRAPGSPP